MDADPAHLPRQARVVLERVGRLVQLDLGLADRLALLGHEDRHELVDVGLERLRARVQEPAAVGVAGAGPVLERRVRRPTARSASCAVAAVTRPTSSPVPGLLISDARRPAVRPSRR